MARIQANEIVDELSSPFRQAIEDAVNEVIPAVNFDSYELFTAFKRALRKKCSNWEYVSDRYVEVD